MKATANAVAPERPRIVAPDASSALCLSNVLKAYRPQGGRWFRSSAPPTQALRGISFQVREGETLGLLGPNGAGKTTLLKIISTLVYPTSGEVTLFGLNARAHAAEVRRMIGLVTCDERSFYWRLTARQNLRFFAALYGVGRDAAEDRIQLLLETLGLAYAADRRYQTFSSGMKQKMAIARGLLRSPRLVLYDEPTRSLDPLSAFTIRNWIAAENSKNPQQARILATNQLHEAEQLCDRVIILNRGEVIAEGTVQKIRDRWRQSEVSVHCVTCRGLDADMQMRPDGSRGLLDVTREECPGETRLTVRATPGSDALSLVLTRILSAGGTVLSCSTEQASFDEIFCSILSSEERPAR